MFWGIFRTLPIYLELTLCCQKTPFSIFWCFRDPNVVQMTWNFANISFWKEQGLGAKEEQKWKAEGKKRWAHAARFLGRVGPLILALEPPMPSIFVSLVSSWPKNDYKNSPPNPFGEERRRNTETMKQRPGAADWRGKTPAGRCRSGLHLLQQLLHRLLDEEGVVHPWTMGLWK